MQTFGEQLTAARKAKGMTQDALAQAVVVTRQTISSWERGRTIPDIDMIRRLSDILGIDLLRAAEGKSDADDAAPPEEPAQDAPASSNVNFSQGGVERRAQTPWMIAGAAVLVCIVLSSLLLFPRKTAPTGGGDVFNAEAYQQETPNEPGRAYITFDHRTWIETGGTDYQMYDFTLTERNGIGFSISRIDVELEGKTGAVRSVSMSAADLEAFTDPDMPAYGSVTIDGGAPKGEFIRAGIAVYGNDVNGEALTFHTLIDF